MIHDTCHCANLVPSKLRVLKEESCILVHGRPAWDCMPEQVKVMHDYLCLNHARGLPVAAFNRLFEEFMKLNHGEDVKAAIAKSGGRARLEFSGPSLIRSMCKLGHDGFGAYAKGDGPEVRLWLEESILNWVMQNSAVQSRARDKTGSLKCLKSCIL